MKKHSFRRLGTFICAAAISVGALAMFAGCTTKHPEITITYHFDGDGKDYAVDYVLSRNDAPKTVQHFLELADAGFYDGTVIHDYQSNALYGGAYKLVNGELEEINYLQEVKTLEEAGNSFTQSVWVDDEPIYAVYGEFYNNGARNQYGTENYHKAGALVMYYTDKKADKFNPDVKVLRADGGKNNGGNPYQSAKYSLNSATSLFYTCTDNSLRGSDDKYAVFGMAKDFDGQMREGLLKAIDDYIETLDEDVSFTEEVTRKLNRYDYFEQFRKGDLDATFNLPKEAITIKSIKINKY